MADKFTNFVVAQSNRFAHAAARAVAESPATAYNPVIIWGRGSVGKTHLLNAICRSVEELHPGLTVKFVTADALVHEFTSDADEGEQDTAVRELKKDAYAECDVLLIDDIHSGMASVDSSNASPTPRFGHPHHDVEDP